MRPDVSDVSDVSDASDVSASDGGAITTALDELEGRPPGEWPALLHARFPADPSLVRQLLLWLHVHRDHAAERSRAALGASTRYELGVRLDRGATASVWQAYDRKLRREVAIKIFDPASSPAIEEILDEARAACEVISEHVVRVLDVHDAEPPYIVMELVGEHQRDGALEPGASAATCRPRDLWEAVRWVRDVARGVHDAHLRDVFHRDLKPHNVLITPTSRRAKIADFGLAVHGTEHVAPGKLAGRARIAGTPGYMAPEQARGLPDALDPRDPAARTTLVGVDIWGLGAIAYDLLSGQAPWRAATGLESWELAAGAGRPAPLDRTPRGERIPPRLRRIVERALAAAPAERYASAGELADELHAVLACRPTSFDRSPALRLGLWARRNPQLTVTALVAVVLGAMSLAAYAAVIHLHDQRTALAAEVRAVEADQARAAAQAAAARRELEDTEANLHTQSDALKALRHSLAEAEDDYRVIVQAKEQALQSANLATRALAAARGERAVAEKTRDLYETFWTRARKDAADAARDRDTAARDRDAARAANEQAIKERDEARAGRTRAEHERDDARSERDRMTAARRLAEAEVARLLGELAAALGAADTEPTKPARTEPTEPTAKGAAH